MSGLPALVVGAMWGAILFAFAWRHRPPPHRLQAMVGRPRRRREPLDGSRTSRPAVRLVSAIEGAGRLARRAAGLRPKTAADRRVGTALVAGVAVAPFSPPLTLVAGVAAWWMPWFVARRRAQVTHDRVLDELPDAIDLLRLALGSGCSLRLAIADVAPHCSGLVGDRFTDVQHRLAYGAPLADALDELHALGDPFRPTLDAMQLAERHGAPIIPLLDRIASDARGARRRRAEEVARRVPVKLLFPLVFCTLPAFGLLTVVPLLASALGRFSL
ncbi:MAG: type II secretion system F family protein [Actinobacteria bacterium]|nr:type II secretion system F family protein [Actinomycetota bacterium]